MINRVVLMGRLVAEPEIKTTPTGVSVTTIRLAVDRNHTPQGEKRVADFIDVVAWNYTAEFVCKTFHKGSLVAVDGSIQGRYIKHKNGKSRYILEVVADDVEPTGESDKKDNSVKNDTASPWNVIEDDTPSNYEQMPLSDNLFP